ncbi:MAG: HNH endonuclease [Actinomycetia bacterium]|nr:HNH endonuclease [Actinomycetes bacterium]
MTEFDPGLRKSQVIAAAELQRLFKCSGQGGMRRSHRTNTLVLISRTSGATYFDRWEGDVFHYTGMGLVGDQNLDRTQNRTLAESDTNGVAVFLFENPRPNEYVFAGRVMLANGPYPEMQRDKDGNERRVWVFPLRARRAGEGLDG